MKKSPNLMIPGETCPRCVDGAIPVLLRCWQCAFEFHVHPYQVAHIPLGRNVLILCPLPDCRAENAFARVPLPDYLIPADEFQSQREAIWHG